MKLYKAILPVVAALSLATGFTSCDEDPVLPPVTAPEATLRNDVNTSILDLKTQYWSDERNYADTVGLTPEGKHVIIAGRVISCDSTGNIYKSLVIQDATAAMAISLDTTKIYNYFPVGEEVVIDMTGQFVGKYNGLFQMGLPKPYNNTYEISFMKYAAFKNAASANGFPEVAKLDTVRTTIEQIKSWTSQDSIIKYQSQLIELNDVSFVGGGTLTWADNGSNANRELRDAKGNTITVRNSAYASFARDVMPAGTGSVVCILSYYGTGWQILFRTTLDCHGFSGSADQPGQPEIPGGGNGSADEPYTVAQVLNAASGSDVWVTGFIVGWVDGVSFTDGAHFDAQATSQSNVLLAATADEKNINNCIPIQLPAGSSVRSDLNLQSHPDNLGKEVAIKGNLAKYFSVSGLKECSAYVWGNKGGDTPEQPKEEAKFTKVNKLTSGKSYILVASGKVAIPLNSNYGYLQVADVTADGNTITCAAEYAFTFTASGSDWLISDPAGKYYNMDATHNSFNVGANDAEGAVWNVTVDADGLFSIKNVARNKTVQYDSQYNSYGAYPDLRGTLPALYEMTE